MSRSIGGWLSRFRGNAGEESIGTAEAYRRLALQLHYDFGQESQGSCVMLTCPDSQAVAENAARVLSAFLAEEQHDRVLLIDGSFSKNSLLEQFQVERAPGLLDLLEGTATIEEAVRDTGHPSIFFLPCGSAPGAPSRLLVADSHRETMDRLREQYGFLLISTPPVLSDATALAFPSLCDCVLLLVLDGKSRMGRVSDCRTAIEHCNSRRIESVLISP